MFPLLGIIISSILISASTNNMKSFKQFFTESNETQIEIDPFGGNERVKRLYGAIVGAEHESAKLEDPYAFNKSVYIRTRAGGGTSSAYGPAQITRNTARGFLKQNPEFFKGIEDYTKQYVEQGNKFLKAKTDDPTYGLGCVGDLCDPKYHEKYQQMTSAIIMGKAKEQKIDLSKDLSDDDLNKFITSWRGATEQQDPRYFKRVRESFRKANTAPQPQQSSPSTTQAPNKPSTSQTAPSR